MVHGRTDSLDPPPPSVVGVPPRTDCYRCREGFGGDNRCRGKPIKIKIVTIIFESYLACNSACNSGLMRCTGPGSTDCCLSFAANGQCNPTTYCTSSSGPNYVATESNNFTCSKYYKCITIIFILDN